MVYNIINRALYRGFHQGPGKSSIIKPDGKTIKGEWLYGCLETVPMPVPAGAKPQMPILCLHSPERRGQLLSESSVCPCTLSLFSGTWMETDWDSAPKAAQRAWMDRGKTSADWQGIPVFEGDIFFHREWKSYFVVTYSLLHGFRLEPAAEDHESPSWFFGQMRHKGTVWAPPKDFPAHQIQKFHTARSADIRKEYIQF